MYDTTGIMYDLSEKAGFLTTRFWKEGRRISPSYALGYIYNDIENAIRDAYEAGLAEAAISSSRRSHSPCTRGADIIFDDVSEDSLFPPVPGYIEPQEHMLGDGSGT